MTYDPQWHAELNGLAIQTALIGPDFIIIYPQTQGDYSLTLHFDRSMGETLNFLVTIGIIVLVAVVSVLEVMLRRPRSEIRKLLLPIKPKWSLKGAQ
jgi:hypothetical protein